MAYRSPELLLIGAAANLVLEGSQQLKIHGPKPDCDSDLDEVGNPIQYDFPENW